MDDEKKEKVEETIEEAVEKEEIVNELEKSIESGEEMNDVLGTVKLDISKLLGNAVEDKHNRRDGA